MRSRNEHEKAERKQALLDAAQKVFFTKGFEHTSMDDIANEAGFSRSLLYVYFSNKIGIFNELKIRASQALHSLMTQYTQRQTTGIDKIKACGLAYYHLYRDNRSFFDCLTHNISLTNQMGESSGCQELDSEESKSTEFAIMGIMVSAIETGLHDGTVNKKMASNPLETALFCRGSLHGIIMLQEEVRNSTFISDNFDGEAFILDSIERMTSLYQLNS